MFTPVPQDISSADILLINADFAKNELGMDTPHENHLGLQRLASYLDEKEISVQIINTTGGSKGRDGSERLASWLNEHGDNYESFGFYVTSWNIIYIIRIISALSNNLKEKPIFFGGPLPSASPDELLKYLAEELNLKNMGLVKGYGEHILEEMVRKRDNLSEVSGLWSYQDGRRSDGELQRLSVTDLENLPLLNHKFNTLYHLYLKPCLERMDLGDMSLDLIFGSFGLDSNHGCPFNCSYCSVPLLSRSVDTYTPQRSVDEMEHTAQETGIFMFTFTYSNVMFFTRDWIREFCQEILRRKMESYVVWNGYQHPNVLDQLDVRDFQLMKDSGCDEIVIGVQSIEEHICDLFHRPKDTFEKVQRLQEKLHKTGQRLVVDYITIVPGENIDAIERFYTYCTKHGIECRNFDLKLYPGTELMAQGFDLMQHDLVPITGDLPKELGAYLFINKSPDPRLAGLQLKIYEFNQELAKKRPIKLGKYYVQGKAFARKLLDEKIPRSECIPTKVKQAFSLILRELLNPKTRGAPLDTHNMEAMLKQIVKDDAPPVLKKIREKMIAEMGEERFESLLQRYGI